MVAEAKIVCQQSVPVLEVQYFGKGTNVHEVEDVVAVSQSISPKSFDRNRASESVSDAITSSQAVSFLTLMLRFLDRLIF